METVIFIPATVGVAFHFPAIRTLEMTTPPAVFVGEGTPKVPETSGQETSL